MRERLLLVDGHNLLFRMFYGMPDNFRTQSGIKYNALYGFISAINKVYGMLAPTHMFVAFDSNDCGDRRSLDSDYKANRPDYSDMEPDDCPFTQLPAIYKALEMLNVPYSEVHGCEADDVIASYAISCRDDFDVIIMSTDRDYWQLVSSTVSILDYHGVNSTLVTPHTVRRKYGVEPSQFADWKCLVGDKSDNIVGVPGVGPKNAASLLTKFGTLECLIERADEIEKPSIKRAIQGAVDRLSLNCRLIKLSEISELPHEISDLQLEYRRPIDINRMCIESLKSAEHAEIVRL